VMEKQFIAPAGIPCVWPSFERYVEKGGYGRHSGTVWPFISAFWGDAVLKHGRSDLFDQEFNTFTAHINRHLQCAEIYHPISGDVYGGLQEAGRGENGLEWESCSRQSWTASAYLRMLLFGVAGLHFDSDGIHFHPYLPVRLNVVTIESLRYRNAILNIKMQGNGKEIVNFMVNGKRTQPFLPSNLSAENLIEIELG